MTVAVTAASGRLGHATLHELVRILGPGEVVGVARTPDNIDVAGTEKRAGDYQSVDQMTQALLDVESAVMISAPVTTGTDRVTMHRNVIEAAKLAGVTKLVYTSVIGNGRERGTWFWPTQQVNRRAEEDLHNSGLEWIVARNGLYLELDLGHIVRANATGVYRNPGADGRCGYITIAELACALARLAIDDTCNGRIVNLTGEPMTQAELVAMANEVFGLQVGYEALTDEQNVARLMQDEKIAARGEEVARMLTGCFQCIRAGAFDVASNFEQAAGRPCLPVRQMMEAVRDASHDRRQ